MRILIKNQQKFGLDNAKVICGVDVCMANVICGVVMCGVNSYPCSLASCGVNV